MVLRRLEREGQRARGGLCGLLDAVIGVEKRPSRGVSEGA